MANMANRQMMRLIREMWSKPGRKMIMATRNEDGTFALKNDIWNYQPRFEPIVCIDTANMYEWDVFIDIRQVILDENLPYFNKSFGFGGDGFPRMRIFRGSEEYFDIHLAYELNLHQNEGLFLRLTRLDHFREEKQAYLATFCASVQLENENTYLWLNTNTDGNNFFTDRDSAIYERMATELPTDTLNAEIPYRSEDLYPFGCITATLTFPEFDPSPPEMTFISPIIHPNIFPDGRVDPRVYAENWRSVQSVKTVLDSILRILKEPDRRYRANEESARRLWGQGQQE